MISTSTMYVCERVGIQMTTYLIETHTYVSFISTARTFILLGESLYVHVFVN